MIIIYVVEHVTIYTEVPQTNLLSSSPVYYIIIVINNNMTSGARIGSSASPKPLSAAANVLHIQRVRLYPPPPQPYIHIIYGLRIHYDIEMFTPPCRAISLLNTTRTTEYTTQRDLSHILSRY